MKKFFRWSLFLLIGGMIYSCAPIRQASYFRYYKDEDDINIPDKIYLMESKEDEIIREGDQLYITVASGSDDPNSFNQPAGTALPDIELFTYEVDYEGLINLPYLGRKKVVGWNLQQAIDTLEKELAQYIYLPAVSIRFVNSRISILGEVNSPGVYIFNRKSISIYQAIAMAGDVADFGNRKNVLIVRKVGNNIQKKYIDITNDKILTTPWYFIQTDDIIYVEPMQRRVWGVNSFPEGLGFIFSLVSTTLLLITFINSRTL